MTDYISREMTIDAICRLCNANFEEDPCEPSDCEMMSLLCKIPAADVVEVRKGRWVLFDNAMSMWNVWVCSECGYRRKEGWMHTEAGKKPEAQYCENCMAKMDGSVNDGT